MISQLHYSWGPLWPDILMSFQLHYTGAPDIKMISQLHYTGGPCGTNISMILLFIFSGAPVAPSYLNKFPVTLHWGP